MFDQCWANVVDGGPTLVKPWVDVSCTYLIADSPQVPHFRFVCYDFTDYRVRLYVRADAAGTAQMAGWLAGRQARTPRLVSGRLRCHRYTSWPGLEPRGVSKGVQTREV